MNELSSRELKTPLSINAYSSPPNQHPSQEPLSSSKHNDFPVKKMYSYRRPFSKMKRKLIFGLVFVINILINFDHGAIPAGTTALKKENNLDNVALGIIGSLVYLGLVLGSISAGPIFNSYSPKWIIILSIMFSCFFLYSFTLLKSIFGMSLCRVGCGFSQVFCYIYFPVWVDQFGISNNKTLWLTFLQLGVPVGTMLGYVIEGFCVKKYDEWKYAFYTQILFLCFTITLFILTPDKFFSRNYKHSESSQDEIEQEFVELKALFEKDEARRGNEKHRLRK